MYLFERSHGQQQCGPSATRSDIPGTGQTIGAGGKLIDIDF